MHDACACLADRSCCMPLCFLFKFRYRITKMISLYSDIYADARYHPFLGNTRRLNGIRGTNLTENRITYEHIPSSPPLLTPPFLTYNHRLPCSQPQMVFAECGLGALVLTGNVILLGGDIVFFQSLCLLGYCLFPLCVSAILCTVFSAVVSQP